jgi:hypothetical protein
MGAVAGAEKARNSHVAYVASTANEPKKGYNGLLGGPLRSMVLHLAGPAVLGPSYTSPALSNLSVTIETVEDPSP